jgi:hypothetical protein
MREHNAAAGMRASPSSSSHVKIQLQTHRHTPTYTTHACGPLNNAEPGLPNFAQHAPPLRLLLHTQARQAWQMRCVALSVRRWTRTKHTTSAAAARVLLHINCMHHRQPQVVPQQVDPLLAHCCVPVVH